MDLFYPTKSIYNGDITNTDTPDIITKINTTPTLEDIHISTRYYYHDPTFLDNNLYESIIQSILNHQNLTNINLPFIKLKPNPPPSSIIQLLNKPNTKYLNLNSTNLSQFSSQPFHITYTLQKLELFNCNIDDTFTQRLSEILSKPNSLNYLDLNLNNITNIGAIHISNMLHINTQLLELKLHQNQITSDGADSIIKSLCTNTTLQYLYINLHQLGSLPSISNMLQTNTTLHALSLKDGNLTNETISNILDNLQHNNTIHTINLESIFNNYLTTHTEFPNSFTNILTKSKPNLQSINLSNNSITHTIITQLAPTLINHTNFTTLELANTQLDNQSIITLSNILSNNKSITYLNLQSANINQTNIQYIANSLRVNTTLSNLNLSRNQLLSEGMIILTKSLIFNSTLRVLDISHCNIGTATNMLVYLLSHDNLTDIHLFGTELSDDTCQLLSNTMEYNTHLRHLFYAHDPNQDTYTQYMYQKLSINYNNYRKATILSNMFNTNLWQRSYLSK